MKSLSIVLSANRIVARDWEGGECGSQRSLGETFRVGRSSNRCASDSWTLMMGPVVCPEPSVRNYHYSLRNNPEERSCQLPVLVKDTDCLRNPMNYIMSLSSSQTFRKFVLIFEKSGNCSPNDIASRHRIL